MIDYRPAAGRAVTRAEGRTTHHAFSFGAHYDPGNTGFGALVAHNEEDLPAGTGYAEHRHVDTEVVTWVLAGALRHRSEVGEGVVVPGTVQRLSAGRGVVHSEVADGEAGVRFVQVWVRPDQTGLEPAYAAAQVPDGPGWRRVAGPGGAVSVASAGSALDVADLAAGQRLALPDAPLLHVHVAAGAVMLGERLQQPGDTARLRAEGGREVRAEADAHLLVWSLRG